jgi:hypothetical protein
VRPGREGRRVKYPKCEVKIRINARMSIFRILQRQLKFPKQRNYS